jgi:hypothetical protein
VHPTLGILARFQAFFYALSFSQSDGAPPPAPARVTQTVGRQSQRANAKPSLIASLVLRLAPRLESYDPFFKQGFVGC